MSCVEVDLILGRGFSATLSIMICIPHLQINSPITHLNLHKTINKRISSEQNRYKENIYREKFQFPLTNKEGVDDFFEEDKYI